MPHSSDNEVLEVRIELEPPMGYNFNALVDAVVEAVSGVAPEDHDWEPCILCNGTLVNPEYELELGESLEDEPEAERPGAPCRMCTGTERPGFWRRPRLGTTSINALHDGLNIFEWGIWNRTQRVLASDTPATLESCLGALRSIAQCVTPHSLLPAQS